MVEKIILTRIIKESRYREVYTGIPREILSRIKKYIDYEEIITLSGVRRSGKSTLFNQLIQQINKPNNILYINFEDERLIDFNVNDFDALLETFFEVNHPEDRIYLFFDEIQEINHWEKWIRRIYDTKKNIKIFITGSSSSLMSSEFSSLLTGRNIGFNLYPFSFKEMLTSNRFDFSDIDMIDLDIKLKGHVNSHLNSYIESGGFPALINHFSVEILQQYFRDIIYRDIVKRYQIRDVNSLERIFIFLLTNIANIINYTNIKKTFHMGIDTIKEYISYGEKANLFYEHVFFSYSLKESYNRNKKIYAIDTGLRNSIAFSFSKDIGRLVEDIVFLQLKREQKEIYYYKGKNEVDFVIKNKDNSLEAINVCYSDDIITREIYGLNEFSENASMINMVKKKTLITRNIDKQENDIVMIPLWKWLLMPRNQDYFS